MLLFSPREVDQSLRKADLPQNLVSRDGSFSRSIEQDMSLLFRIFVIGRYACIWSKSRIVDSKIEQPWRDSAHEVVVVLKRADAATHAASRASDPAREWASTGSRSAITAEALKSIAVRALA